MARNGIQGNILAKLGTRLIELGAEGEKAVKAETAAVGFDIVADAKINASMIPNAPPELKQMISSEVVNNGFTVMVRQNFLPMGAYMEFGTGVYVKVAPEWKDYAWQFYVNGKGRLRATPYLYPAYTKHRKLLRQNFEKRIQMMIKNFSVK